MSTYFEIVSQIESLKKRADKARREELGEVIKTIKQQIAAFGITAADLGLSTATGRSKSKNSRTGSASAAQRRKPRTKRSNVGAKVPPKYRDDAGNTWTGRGKQPKWVVQAIATGRSLESMLIR